MENRLFTEERREEIVRLLHETKSLSVQDLSQRFEVSGATIRTDLTALEQQGCLRRTHGGAVPPSASVPREISLSEREHAKEKRAIAEAALRYVESHETILIDSGTTTAEFDRALAASRLSGVTVYSNDLFGMQILEAKESFELHLLGGTIRSGFHYTYGKQVLEELRGYHFRKLFLAASALSTEGLTSACSDLCDVKHAMIASAEQVILLMDSSKIGEIGFQKFADLNDIDILITDSGIRESALKKLRKQIPEVVIAK